jgi:hypothetical protein
LINIGYKLNKYLSTKRHTTDHLEHGKILNVISEMKIKTSMRNDLIPVRIVFITKQIRKTHVWMRIQKYWNLCSLLVEMQTVSCNRKQYGKSLKKIKNRATIWSSNLTLWVFIQKNWNETLKEILVHLCSQLQYSQQSRYGNNPNIHD